MNKTTSFFIFFTLISLSLFVGCTEKKNLSADDFSFTTLDGQTRRLSEFYGTVVILDCMAVNCQPCISQMFELKKISENYSSNNVAILSIDVWVSSGETPSMLQGIIDAFKTQVNITLDWTFGLDYTKGTIQNAYASQGVPTLYIFDTKGNIYYSHVGYEDYVSLSSKLDEVLTTS
jgi:thiol-disulfide isomerase/thioredoxin